MPEYSVLIVEDDPIIVRVLFSMLEYENFHVLTPIDAGEQVIEQVTLEKPDIILMDIDLPGKITGIEAASILFNIFCIPVIFVTGHDEKQILNKAMESMPFGFLIKPVNPDLLFSSIRVGINLCSKMRLTTEGMISGLSESMKKKLTESSGFYLLVDDMNHILLANQGAEELFKTDSSNLFNNDLLTTFQNIISDNESPNSDLLDDLTNHRPVKVNIGNRESKCTVNIESVKNLFGVKSGSFISIIFPDNNY